MKRLGGVVAAVLMGAMLSWGCAPVLIGAIAYGMVKDKKARQVFMSSLQHTNMEREAKGLEPLDTCRETYMFDKAWARRDRACKAKIVEWEEEARAEERAVNAVRAEQGLPPIDKPKKGNKYR